MDERSGRAGGESEERRQPGRDKRTRPRRSREALTEAVGIEEEVPDSAEDKEGGGASRAARLDKLLNDLEGKLNKGEYKPSIGDFIRLLQLRKEIEEERPREITVTWVEPFEGGNAGA